MDVQFGLIPKRYCVSNKAGSLTRFGRGTNVQSYPSTEKELTHACASSGIRFGGRVINEVRVLDVFSYSNPTHTHVISHFLCFGTMSGNLGLQETQVKATRHIHPTRIHVLCTHGLARHLGGTPFM